LSKINEKEDGDLASEEQFTRVY